VGRLVQNIGAEHPASLHDEGSGMSEGMTKGERDDLAKLVRRREKLAKADADRLAAERLADFEHQMASVYRPADDEVWRELHAAAAAAVADAKERLVNRCHELGIPEEFQPDISMLWYGRGENAARSRRAELRAVAKTRIDAEAKRAKTEIERHSLNVQTSLVAGALVSEEAKRFLESMPSAAELMSATPTVAEIESSLVPLRQLAALR